MIPADWRKDAAFMVEYCGLGPYERVSVATMIGQKRPLTDKQSRFLARLAVQVFPDAAGYKEAAA